MGETKADAREQLRKRGVPFGQSFNWLGRAYVERIEQAAKAHEYQRPDRVRGSTARCFYEYANK